MAVKKVNEIMLEAYREKRAVMCFECVNYEQIAWSIQAAEEVNSPVILMLYYDMTFYTSAELFVKIAETLAKAARIPVGITYVYANTYELAMDAVSAGFPSICYDPQGEDLETKIAETKTIVQEAHQKGVDVVANPGEYGSVTVQDAVRFVRETGIDGMVAPVVYGDKGNNTHFTESRHWYESNIDYIDFEMLEEIHKEADLPLVIHRSYNISTEQLQKSLEYGVTKVDNGCPFDTQFYHAAEIAIKTTDCGESYFALLMNMQEQVKSYLKMCICNISGRQ